MVAIVAVVANHYLIGRSNPVSRRAFKRRMASLVCWDKLAALIKHVHIL
jgi:hypothetical protein